MIALIGWLYTQNVIGTVIFAAIIFVSILVHEFGHALTAAAFGHRAYIELWAMGGLTHRTGPKLRLWKEFVIVMNGPLCGFGLGLAAYVTLHFIGSEASTLLVQMLWVTYFVNIFWTLLNLLPIIPLDGGHLLRILMEGALGMKGVKIAFFISFILAACLALLSMYAGQIFLMIIFFMFTFEGFRSFQSLWHVTETDRNDQMQLVLKEAETIFHEGNHEVAAEKFKAIMRETKQGIIFVTASEYLAQIYYEQKRFDEAYTLLSENIRQLSLPALSLLQKLSYQLRSWKEGTQVGNRIYQIEQDPQVAYINALCHANLGEKNETLGWIKAAIKEGLPNLEQALNHPDFKSIRESQEFKVLLNEFR